MITLTAIAMTCWLCTLIATPRKPLINNEVQELVYTRLLGRQQVLKLLALVATAGAFFALVALARPDQIDPDFRALRHANAACLQGTYDSTACATPQPGTRVVREIQDDGRSAVISTFAVPTR